MAAKEAAQGLLASLRELSRKRFVLFDCMARTSFWGKNGEEITAYGGAWKDGR